MTQLIAQLDKGNIIPMGKVVAGNLFNMSIKPSTYVV
jgi:hypothetical protein